MRLSARFHKDKISKIASLTPFAFISVNCPPHCSNARRKR
jgi:hypothetical protein